MECGRATTSVEHTGCKGTSRWWLRFRRPCCRSCPCRWQTAHQHLRGASKSEMSERHHKDSSGERGADGPGPKYSTMAPVPPFTVRMPASFRMTSLGEAQPLSLPMHAVEQSSPSRFDETGRTRELDTDDLGGLELPWDASHDIDGVRATNTDGGHALRRQILSQDSSGSEDAPDHQRWGCASPCRS